MSNPSSEAQDWCPFCDPSLTHVRNPNDSDLIAAHFAKAHPTVRVTWTRPHAGVPA